MDKVGPGQLATAAAAVRRKRTKCTLKAELCFVHNPAECWGGFSAGGLFRRPRPQGCGRWIATAYMSLRVHVFLGGGEGGCLLGASVLNSLSMCDKSSGWEKNGTVHGLTWPLTFWILKTLSISQGLGLPFCPVPYLAILSACLCITISVSSAVSVFVSHSFSLVPVLYRRTECGDATSVRDR